MKNRSCANIIRYLLLFGVMSFLTDCSPTIAIQANHASKKKESAMSLAYQTVTESPAIPPIDAAAPSIFETASFGLG